jgi:Glyoxalase-like domain
VSEIRLGSVSLDCDDPASLGDFWAALLDGEVAFSSDHFVAVKLANLWISSVRVDGYVPPAWPTGDAPKQIHLDLAVKDLDSSAARALSLGATRPDHQPGSDRWVVLLDPAGHPFCLTTQIPD